jgi:hypothetical protein
MAPLRGFFMVNSASAAPNISQEENINLPLDMPEGHQRLQSQTRYVSQALEDDKPLLSRKSHIFIGTL